MKGTSVAHFFMTTSSPALFLCEFIHVFITQSIQFTFGAFVPACTTFMVALWIVTTLHEKRKTYILIFVTALTWACTGIEGFSTTLVTMERSWLSTDDVWLKIKKQKTVNENIFTMWQKTRSSLDIYLINDERITFIGWATLGLTIIARTDISQVAWWAFCRTCTSRLVNGSYVPK